MDLKMNVVDVSSFFLFEGTGDSEIDFDHHPTMASTETRDHADDDAESCSYTHVSFSDSGSIVTEFSDCTFKGFFDEKDVGNYREEKDEEVEDQEEVNSYQTVDSSRKKTSVNVIDSVKKLMNEKERSKLFWEACLAS
ncbi:uncharacterized protein LOC110821361 [Carica papaya]|uniref:uncharacterized protein LOC110821361 n=1 Tax=Carica papaya TaxID=3649 RepID=UPI000B8CA50C|nr:uncharacterized protein LOC110821361 [Carica papaya]